MEAVTPVRAIKKGERKWAKALQVKYFDIFINKNKVNEILATPLNIKELAVGFVLSNGYVEDPGSIEGVNVGDGSVHVLVGPEYDYKLSFMHGHPLENIDIKPVVSPFTIPEEKILEKIIFEEGDFALISDNNGYLAKAIDVSHTNAFYKVIGKAVVDGFDARNSFLVLSPKLLPEDVVRAAYVGIPVVGVVGRVTDLAVTAAENLGVTLFGLGLDGLEIYTHPSRIL